jgi:hypothetical protein
VRAPILAREKNQKDGTPGAMSAPSIKLQPKRRGTDAASAWARALRLRLFDERGDGKARIINTGIPAKDVKHLLLTIAQYVDHEGRCFPSFQTLADDTEMSWDSIKRRLADLEYLNLIARRDPAALRYQPGRNRRASLGSPAGRRWQTPGA